VEGATADCCTLLIERLLLPENGKWEIGKAGYIAALHGKQT